jgi:long-subunit fatty acid transport protein
VLRRCSLLAAALAALLAPKVLAGPLDDPHVGDTGFSGPTSGDLTAVYWNPAGLGLLQGPQLMLGGTLTLRSATVDRAGIDPATGATFPTATGSATSHPLRWPLGPNGFFALGAGIGHRFGIAVALYSPYATKLTMKPTASGEEPASYHLVGMELNHIAPQVGLAIHASDSIQIGIAPGILLPSAHLVFDEDTGMGNPASTGVEDPAAAARYDLASKGWLLTPTYFLSLGAHYKRGRLSIGLSYTSAPLGSGGLVTIPLDNVQIRFPASDASSSLCPASNPGCLFGQMSYRLPSIWTLGATWQATKHWAATAIVRWVRTGSHDKVTILVSGPPAQLGPHAAIPDHVVLYRGFKDSFDMRARVVYQSNHLRLGGTLRLETSAVPQSHVNAAAIDGTTIEPMLSAEMRIWRQISLSVSYAFAYMLPVDTGTSVFDPTASSTCATSGGDLTTPACQARMDGRARPSAAGRYHWHAQTLSVLTTFGF